MDSKNIAEVPVPTLEPFGAQRAKALGVTPGTAHPPSRESPPAPLWTQRSKAYGGTPGPSTQQPAKAYGGAPSPSLPRPPSLSDTEAAALAAAILASPRIIDARVTALCRWVLNADIAGLRSALIARDVALAEARAEAARAVNNFFCMRALHADRLRVDEDLPEATFDDEEEKETGTARWTVTP